VPGILNKDQKQRSHIFYKFNQKTVKSQSLNKRKIINDPVYGFISIPDELIFDIIEHPYFQRLRRIKQLGLTHLVYPGALHTRFQHALGAMYLMDQAIETLRSKGLEITEKEGQGLRIAILLHDVGHGPYSHALEHSIVDKLNHEDISLMFIDRLNEFFKGELTLARNIYSGDYPKKFLRQLVASQLDVDRLDYLKRDSFFTGVSEGIISADRIIKMMNVCNDELAVEAKGIYSVEKFIVARRLMYWQVYLHKTVLAAEHLMINILRRAKELAMKGTDLFATPSLQVFLKKPHSDIDFIEDRTVLEDFSMLDDFDIFTSIKVWMDHDDDVLSTLCRKMVNRNLFRIEIQNEPFDPEKIERIKKIVAKHYKLEASDIHYFVFTEEVANNMYNPDFDKINILYRDGRAMDITESSDQLNVDVLSKTVKKFFLCYPKECGISE
jgi:uncharacterized protein